jgi:hypothetical protein
MYTVDAKNLSSGIETALLDNSTSGLKLDFPVSAGGYQ